MRVKTYFRLTPRVLYLSIEGCRSVIIKRSISVIDQQHLKWNGLEFFNRPRCTTLFARRFNHTRTRPVTSLQARYPSACLNDLLETLFISSLFRNVCCEFRRQLIFHQVCVHVLRSISSFGFVVEWRRLLGFCKRMTCLINLTLMSVTFTTHANLNYIFLVQKNIWNGALWNSTFICRELPVSLVINRRSQVSQCELIGKRTGPQRRERKQLETVCMSNAYWVVQGNLSQLPWRNHLSCW